jgi:glycosyltransferase involved in cell wall biosynthesis
MEQATYELISAIAELDRQNEYRVYAPRSTCCEWNFPATFKFCTHPSDQVERDAEALRSFVANRLGETLGAPPILTPTMRSLAAFSRMDFDFVHSVAGYTHPDLLGHPGVLTINDLQHLHYPDFFAREEWEERERLYRSSAEKAQHIICISEHTRQDVHRQYGVPLEKLTTVWIIPSRNVWREIAVGLQRDLLRSLGLDGPFFFFPAHCWPHKNHARLVQAFARIRGELPGNFRLVLTGRTFPEEHPARTLIRDLQLELQIVHLGYRSPLEIRALFQGCSGLVFPSLFEGYGMPVAEAIIAGRPVACSNTTSLPEIAGNAALTFDPSDVEDIAAKLLQLATDRECRASLESAALQRRTIFSAHRRAVETLAIYRKVYAELCEG